MKTKKLLFTVFLVLFSAGIVFAQGGTIHYVTTTGAGTKSGDSWGNASDNIQTIVNNAAAGDEVWVAKGNYVFDRGLELKGGVAVYGGFDGTENSVNQRNWEQNETHIESNFGTNSGDTYIYNSSATLSVIDGFYIFCRPLTQEESDYGFYGKLGVGAAVYNIGKLEIRNTIIANFINWRGAVYNNNDMKLYNVTFKNNFGTVYEGSAVVAYSGTLLVDNCTFTENKATEKGAAIFCRNAVQLVIKNSSFYKNSNITMSYGYYGTAISLFDHTSTAEIENCVFEENQGGSSVVSFPRSGTPESLSFKNCQFKNNAAPYGLMSGGIYVTCFQSSAINRITIEDCLFDGNSSISGGAITIDGYDCSIKNSTFSNNKAMDVGGLSVYGRKNGGGDVGCYDFTVDIDNVIISGNEAEMAGGGAFSGRNMTLSNLQVMNNKAIDRDGYGGIVLSGGVTLKNSTIENNISAKNGGGITAADCTISDVVVKNNTAATDGGGIYISGGVPVLKNITVSGNTAGGSGGGIFGASSIENSTISNNKANGSGGISGGGGMYGATSIKECIIENNETAGKGGGVYGGNFFENSSFLSNKASSGGGISSSSGVVKNCKIKGNTASNNGGGISINENTFSDATFVINNSVISGNKAGNNGGGFYSGYWTYLWVVNSTVSGNNANAGGGMYDISYHYQSVLNNSVIKGNGNNDLYYLIDPSVANSPSVANCLIGNMNPTGANNFNDTFGKTNPQFVNPVDASLAPTVDGDYSLKSSSPLINKGNNDFLAFEANGNSVSIDKDLNNNPRIYNNGIVDIGAYEYQGEPQIINVSSISLNKSEINMSYIDAPIQLIPTILPEDATNKSVTWSSSASNVASVSSSGLVTAKTIGNAIITVTTVDGGKTATCSVKVTDISYTLTVSNGTGSGNYYAGTVVNISANAAPAGQIFDQWTGDVSGVADVTAANTTYAMGSANASITATYKEHVLYSLTVTNGTGSGNYYAGTVVPIVANTPPAGKEFDQWVFDVYRITDIYAASTTYTMGNTDASIRATYKDLPRQYPLTVINGTGSGSYTAGTVVPIVADTPPVGMEFDQWTIDIEGVADMYAANTTYTIGNSASAEVMATYKSATGIEPVEAGIKIYAEGSSVRIESGGAIQLVEIYNPLGQAIRLVRPDSNQAKIDNLPTGILIVKVSLQDGNFEIKKVIIR